MHTAADWNGRLLADALNETPALTLNFYSFGVMLRKCDGDRVSEYPVEPSQVAAALSARMRFETGLLDRHTLLVRHDGERRTVVGYRPARLTGLYIDTSETALRIPLPPLVLVRTVEGANRSYSLFAVKRRPTFDTPLFHAPLSNVFGSGAICWGTVPRPAEEGASLEPDWSALIGSSFGDHACGGKSQRHPSDVRKLWVELEREAKKRYPFGDLCAVGKTFGQFVGLGKDDA